MITESLIVAGLPALSRNMLEGYRQVATIRICTVNHKEQSIEGLQELFHYLGVVNPQEAIDVLNEAKEGCPSETIVGGFHVLVV